MVMLDALYHLATETAVHINYVAVKFTVIFLVVFLVVYWVGKGITDGIFTSVAGPVIFYVYYIFANATLNREIFKIDENFGYIFVHIAALLIAYFSVYNSWTMKKGSPVAKSIIYSFIVSISIFGLITAYKLSYVQYTTHNEEINARVLNFKSSIYLFSMLFLLSFLSNFFIRSKNIEMAVLIGGAAIIIYFAGRNITEGLIGIAASSIPVYLSKLYLKIIK